MCERKLLDYGGAAPADPLLAPSTKPEKSSPKSGDGFWSRLAARLEEIGEMKDVNGIPVSGQRRPKDKDKKKSRW